ncbi:MAG TPA: AAA family ATPase [Phycisphaerae bacterium]|nr:AAA family ATPase [Phycisphaerae bacterium]
MQTIAIVNEKGGTAKTSTAVNLAAALGQMGKEVLLVDLDGQAAASRWLGCEEDHRLADAILAGGGLKPLEHVIPGVSLAPASGKLDSVAHNLRPTQGGRLHRVIGELEGRYSHVLIDCPPSLGNRLIGNALLAATHAIAPVEPSVLALDGLRILLTMLEDIRDGFDHPIDLIGVVVCRYEPRTRLSRLVLSELRQIMSGRVFRTVIRETIRMQECPASGKSIMEYAPGCAAARDYLALAEELLSGQARGDHGVEMLADLAADHELTPSDKLTVLGFRERVAALLGSPARKPSGTARQAAAGPSTSAGAPAPSVPAAEPRADSATAVPISPAPGVTEAQAPPVAVASAVPSPDETEALSDVAVPAPVPLAHAEALAGGHFGEGRAAAPWEELGRALPNGGPGPQPFPGVEEDAQANDWGSSTPWTSRCRRRARRRLIAAAATTLSAAALLALAWGGWLLLARLKPAPQSAVASEAAASVEVAVSAPEPPADLRPAVTDEPTADTPSALPSPAEGSEFDSWLGQCQPEESEPASEIEWMSQTPEVSIAPTYSTAQQPPRIGEAAPAAGAAQQPVRPEGPTPVKADKDRAVHSVRYRESPPGFELSGILGGPAGNWAIINGKMVGVGHTVNGARVVRIGPDTAEMELNGERFMLGVGSQPVRSEKVPATQPAGDRAQGDDLKEGPEP